MKIGFIGLGRMGAAMAENLIRAGHELVLYNRSRAKAEALAGLGASVAGSLAEACQAEVVWTMLADDAAVEQVVHDKGGLLDSLARFTFPRARSASPCASVSRRRTRRVVSASWRRLCSDAPRRPKRRSSL